MTLTEIIILITSGLFVGFINTLSGGATVISISVLMFLGLSPFQAIVVNRIPIFFQTITSSAIFVRKKILDLKRGTRIAIPVVIGSIVGSFIALEVNQKLFNYALGIILLMMLFFMFYKPELWLKGNPKRFGKKIDWLTDFFFFLCGIYGGFLHVGVGYFFLIGLVLILGYDLIKGNAIKNYIVLLYVPFPIIIFMINGDLTMKLAIYGLIHAIGNVIGATIASSVAISWGAKFVRYLMLVMIVITALNLFGVLDFSHLASLVK